MKVAELKSKTVAELRTVLVDLRKEKFNLRIQKVNGQLDNLARFKVIRKNIARVKTVISEKIKIDNLGRDN